MPNDHRRDPERSIKRGTLAPTVFSAALFLWTGIPSAWAQDAQSSAQLESSFSIPAQALETALDAFRAQTKTEINISRRLLNNRTSTEVEGRFSPLEALQRLLQDTNLTAKQQTDGSLVILSPEQVSSLDQTVDNGAPAPEIDDVVVATGRKRAGGIARQRAAANIRSVLSIDEATKLPVQDLSEVIEFAPGVSLEETNGSGTTLGRGFQSSFISIRGIQPELNNITIYGQDLISTQGERDVALDILPANAASLVDINKTLTPDMSANAIGGSVNILPLSAFERVRPFFEANVEGGFSDDSFKGVSDDPAFQLLELQPDYQINAAGGARFGPQDQFGIALAANLADESAPLALRQCDDWSFNAGRNSALPDDLQVCEGQRLENGVRTRERKSLNATFEFRPADRVEFFASGVYSDTEERSVSLQTEDNFADDLENSEIEDLGNGVFRNFGIPGIGFVNVDKEMDNDVEEEEFIFLVGGGSFGRGPFTADLRASYARGESNEEVREFEASPLVTNTNPAGFRPLGSVVFDLNDEVLRARPDNPNAFFDPNNFTLDNVTIEPQETVAESEQIEASLRYDGDWFGSQLSLEQGIAFDAREVERDDSFFAFIPTFGGALDGASLAETGLGADPGAVFGFPVGVSISPAEIERFIREFQPMLGQGEVDLGAQTSDFPNFMSTFGPDAPPLSFFPIPSAQLEDDFKVSEDVAAGYLLAEISQGRLSLVGGVRVEYTETESELQVFNDATGTEAEEPIANSYTDVLPSLNGQYELSDSLVIRGAYSRSIARAPLNQLAGSAQVGFDLSDLSDDNVVRQGFIGRGNPNLDPFVSDNFDLSLEWYPSANSLFSVGGFFKSIDDPIFSFQETVRDFEFAGLRFEEATLVQPVNAGSGELYGLEAAVDYRFESGKGPIETPSLLDDFGLTANFTLMDSELDGVPARPDETFSLLRQPDVIVRFTPFYERGGFAARLSYSFTGEQLTSINDTKPDVGLAQAGDGQFDEFLDARETISASIRYTFADRVTISVSAENITEEPFRAFQGRSSNEEEFVARPAIYWFGISGKF